MSTYSDFQQHQLDEQSGRELDAHAEKLKRSLEIGQCPKCSRFRILTEINPKNIKFRCAITGACGWFAIYPTATVGNSSPLHAENAALREEVAHLKAQIEEINLGIAAELAQEAEYEERDYMDQMYSTEAERLGER